MIYFVIMAILLFGIILLIGGVSCMIINSISDLEEKVDKNNTENTTKFISILRHLSRIDEKTEKKKKGKEKTYFIIDKNGNRIFYRRILKFTENDKQYILQHSNNQTTIINKDNIMSITEDCEEKNTAI